MALDYRKCAEEIAKNIGGGSNVVSAAHCATRLRLVIADNDKINKKALENVDGVQGMFENAGQLQLIIGTGTVNKVYDEFLAVTGASAASKDDVKAAAAAQQPLWRRVIKTLGDVFVPILPAIVASGLLMGIVEGLGRAIPAFSASGWYGFLDMIASTALAYLPVLVAVSAARVFGANIFLGGVIGLSMINSGLLNGWNNGNEEAINSFFGIDTGILPTWDLAPFIHIKRMGYQGHVIPVVIAIFLLAKIENKLHKIVPEMLDLFVVPLVSVFVTYFLTFWIIGPIFSTVETYVLEFFQFLVKIPFGIGALLCGAIYPFTVVMGLHHMFNIIELGMLASKEFNNTNIWMPIASSANFAQFGACLAVGIKSHRAKTKSIAVPASMSAALGITEPAIFGVNLRYLKPLICGSIGGAIGAAFGSITSIGASANGVTGIPGFLIIKEGKVGLYAVMLLISCGIAFALSFITHKDEEEEEEAAPETKTEAAPAVAAAPSAPAAGSYDTSGVAKEVITAIKSEEVKLDSPTPGEVVPYTEIPDPAFASGALGNGVGVKPSQDIVYAPMDGEIISVVDSKHAVGIQGENGVELLIHVGVDTVKMNGDGFNCFVEQGAKIKKGDKLIAFDSKKIADAGYSNMVVVLVTNSFEYSEVKVAGQ